MCLKSTTARIQRYLNRKLFYFKGYTEYLSSKGSPYVQLERFPVYDIRRIEYLKPICPPASYCESSYLNHKKGESGLVGLSSGMPNTMGPYYNLLSHSPTLGPDSQLIKIIYDGGYMLESEAADAACTPAIPELEGEESASIVYPPAQPVQMMPEDIRMACIIESARMLKMMRSGSKVSDPNVRSTSFSDRSESYFGTGERNAGIAGGYSLSFESQELLSSYRVGVYR